MFEWVVPGNGSVGRPVQSRSEEAGLKVVEKFLSFFEDSTLKISEKGTFKCSLVPFPPLVSIVPLVRTSVVSFVPRFLFVCSFAQDVRSFVSG